MIESMKIYPHRSTKSYSKMVIIAYFIDLDNYVEEKTRMVPGQLMGILSLRRPHLVGSSGTNLCRATR